ncbi:sugar transferase, partial [Bacillus intestinalis]|nr:sugar transferase [Bacillus spizizenii]
CYMYRYRVRPGITGWAQVNGYRGETRKVEAMEARVKFDLFYMQNWSFWFDIKIILMTVVRGFIGRNAF